MIMIREKLKKKKKIKINPKKTENRKKKIAKNSQKKKSKLINIKTWSKWESSKKKLKNSLIQFIGQNFSLLLLNKIY